MITRSPEVDAHVAAAAEPYRGTLEHIRGLILETLPAADTVETIGYGVPTYKYRGRNLIHFAAAKEHCSLFPGSEAVALHATELVGFSTDKGTIRFSPDRPIPDELVRTLILEGVARIDAHLEKARRR
jgi:uncharacterized protein YdhG (YjbR/CyaY superfamily)